MKRVTDVIRLLHYLPQMSASSMPSTLCVSPLVAIASGVGAGAQSGLAAAGHRYLATAVAPSSAPSLAQLLAPDLPPGLPPAKPLQVKSVSMRGSATSLQQCPSDGLPELAIVGRSNVGKSSLINMLVGSAKMAQVSKTPGKTQALNYYQVNKAWYLVDCPGYGYARVAKQSRMQWLRACEELCLYRPTLLSVLLLVDSSLPAKEVDLDAAQWFAEHAVPFSVLFTKADKKKAGCPAPRDNIAAFRAHLADTYEPRPPSIVTSAQAGYGRSELLGLISQLLQLQQRQVQQQGPAGS